MKDIPPELIHIIQSYKLTIICMSVAIILSFCLFAWVLLYEVPSITKAVVQPVVRDEVRAAFNEEVESAITQ